MLKINKFSVGIVGFAILLQYICMRNAPIFEYELPFLSGIQTTDSMSGGTLLVLYSCIPIWFLLICCSGDMDAVTRGYGRVLIIRNYKREKMVAKVLVKTIFLITIMTGAMVIIFCVGRSDDWQYISYAGKIKALLIYIITLTAMVYMQYFLELCMKPQQASLIIIISICVMLLISNVDGILDGERKWNFVFFLNLAFAQKNGVLSSSAMGISYNISLGWSTLICIFFGGLCVKKIKSKDIF